MWNVKFLSEAEADMHSLDNSLKKQILKERIKWNIKEII